MGLLAAAQPLRVSWRECRDEDMADSHGAEICVLPVGPAASGGTACMRFTCIGCHVLNEMGLQKMER